MEKAYFPMFMNMEEKTVLVFGAGQIAARRVEVLLRFGCIITLEAPHISPELEDVIRGHRITIIKQEYQPGDVPEETDYVLAITDNEEVNDRIYRECRHKEIPVNVASDRSKCDFYFPAIIESEDIIIGITSSGSNHKKVSELAEKLREQLP